MTTENIQIEHGSFRDPSGCVFYLDGEVYRSVDEPTYALLTSLHEQGLLSQLEDEGMIVPTEPIVPESDMARRLAAAIPGGSRFLRHETVPFVSYPYEWSATMLADAGILHLDLQIRLLQNGCSLKDATAFNVAFVGSQPVFMDVPSIEVPRRFDIWVAYGQFCRMFVYPILLHSYRGIDLKQSFLSELAGPSVGATRRMLGLLNSLRPAALVDVFMQNILNAGAEMRIARNIQKAEAGEITDTATQDRAWMIKPDKGGVSSGSASEKKALPDRDIRVQTINLTRLRNKLLRMTRADRAQSAWSGYERTHSYDQTGDEEKVAFVNQCLAADPPSTVLDLGCNTGRYARLAADTGARVLAADADHDCIDLLYRRLRDESADILPLCMDITNPAPALGFRHRERKSFEQRADFDGVLALALVHHLLVSARIPLPSLCDYFAELAGKWLVVEYVGVHDPMFQQLLATRENHYQDLTPKRFEAVFKSRFIIENKREIMNGRRVLYFMRKNAGVSE